MTEKGNASVAENAQEQLVITRIFNAPRALVWRAWTDAQHLMRW
jgi:uncharacterized protein YndB with AHSA1/START domain